LGGFGGRRPDVHGLPRPRQRGAADDLRRLRPRLPHVLRRAAAGPSAQGHVALLAMRMKDTASVQLLYTTRQQDAVTMRRRQRRAAAGGGGKTRPTARPGGPSPAIRARGRGAGPLWTPARPRRLRPTQRAARRPLAARATAAVAVAADREALRLCPP